MPRGSTSRSNGEEHTNGTNGRRTEDGDGDWLTSHPGDNNDGVGPDGGPDEPTQTEEERRQIRQNLRGFVEKLKRDEEALVETNPDDLKKILVEAQAEFQKVKTPREGVIQSRCVAMFASLAKRKAQNLTTEFVRFNPVEFVEKVLTFTQTSCPLEEDGLSKEGWNFLGEKCQPYFQRAAPFRCMLGTFERGEVITGRVPRQRVVREKEHITEADKTKLQEVKQGELSSLETTTREVEERVLPWLLELYERVGRKPICYFEFVINPQSYTHTVENMFHVSFLVKSGHAELFLDEDKLPVIRPNHNMEEEGETSGAMTQMIQSLSYQQWKDIAETFEITEPLLEPK